MIFHSILSYYAILYNSTIRPSLGKCFLKQTPCLLAVLPVCLPGLLPGFLSVCLPGFLSGPTDNLSTGTLQIRQNVKGYQGAGGLLPYFRHD